MTEEPRSRREEDQRPQPEDDRVVADMNVEGMPWYQRKRPRLSFQPPPEPLTGKALWRYTFAAVGAGLAAVAIFGLAGAAFIWFCTNVWLK